MFHFGFVLVQATWFESLGLPLGGLASVAALLLAVLLAIELAGLRYIPHDRVGLIEKLWSMKGPVPEGRIIALNGEAGFQADVVRGGLHFGLWRWQYRIHRVPLVTVRQGRIGYVYARDGEPLAFGQAMGRVVFCDSFQDARAFLGESDGAGALVGQRGRQRAILREGVYAVNLALFVVFTEDEVYHLRWRAGGDLNAKSLSDWQRDLLERNGYHPVVVGESITAPDPVHVGVTIETDSIGIVTVHDGPSLAAGEIIAPAVGIDAADPHFHDNYQNTEAFLRAGGRRGRQYVPLTDGTYFINRWFVSIELIPKTVVPIGYVGVVVSYFGKAGRDLSGESFRHGELVSEGDRGVRARPLGPGKYAFNTYAGSIVLVPTTNFVLHWITGKSESHRYDESLRSIDLVTRDAYEPALPLSVVVHIDYEKAPNVIQRFGDVKKLITQTLDPMLSAFFRDVAHRKTMLELLHDRDLIQREARSELRDRFHEFDIECVDVLIGKPAPIDSDQKIEQLLEQLRLRQLSMEQLETYDRQRAAAEKLRALNEAQTQAAAQAQLTQSRVQIQIEENKGAAELARSRKQAEQMVVVADAELARSRKQAEQTIVSADADCRSRILQGQGEGQRRLQEGQAEATVLTKKIEAFSDPRLYALSEVVGQLATGRQPLVPERLFVSGSDGTAGSFGPLGMLLNILLAQSAGVDVGAVATDTKPAGSAVTTLEEPADSAAPQKSLLAS